MVFFGGVETNLETTASSVISEEGFEGGSMGIWIVTNSFSSGSSPSWEDAPSEMSLFLVESERNAEMTHVVNVRGEIRIEG